MKRTLKEWEAERTQIWNDFKKAEQEFLRKVTELDTDYAMEHARFKVGDVITNGTTTIRIDQVKFNGNGWNFIDPYLDYYGEILTNKRHKPTGKAGRLRGVFQNEYQVVAEATK